MSGNLTIRVLSAQLTHNTDKFRRMDPYVKATFGSHVQMTMVAQDAGKHPSWNQELVFRRMTEDILTLEVWDKDKTTRDDLVGSCTVAFATIQKKGYKINEWLELSYKGRSAGQLLVEMSFVPDGYGIHGQTMGMQQPMMTTGMVQQTYVQPTYQQPQMGFQQQVYPQQTFPQQTVIPQQAFVQQPSYPQQQMYPQQTIPQQTFVQQTIPQQNYNQPRPMQQGYPQQGFPQQGG